MKYPIYVHPAYALEILVAGDGGGLLKAVERGIAMSPIGEVLVSEKRTIFSEEQHSEVAG